MLPLTMLCIKLTADGLSLEFLHESVCMARNRARKLSGQTVFGRFAKIQVSFPPHISKIIENFQLIIDSNQQDVPASEIGLVIAAIPDP